MHCNFAFTLRLKRKLCLLNLTARGGSSAIAWPETGEILILQRNYFHRVPFGGSNCFWSSVNLKGGGIYIVDADNEFLVSCKNRLVSRTKPFKILLKGMFLCMMSYRI